MKIRAAAGAGGFALALGLISSPVSAQHHHPAPADTSRHGTAHGTGHSTGTGTHPMMGRDMGMPGMDLSGMHEPMTGLYGPYPMTREATGTAWQPDGAEHTGIHAMRGGWMLMLHGDADLVFDHQGSARGDDKFFSDNMVMGMAQRTLGPGTFGLKTMLSLEPATIGKEGYPLLLQTGETADGITPLIDRQHPHDLFMELAGTYSVSSGNHSFFLYGGLPGEPALGPPAFMHRFSGSNLPMAPITHHWLDSTHITFGVLTAGVVVDHVKLEASAFRGREPDEHRWGIESPKLDSHSFRLSVNPGSHLALQVSYGRLESPEQLEPGVDQDRTTASAMYDGRWSGGHWETTLAWGRNRNRPGHILDALAGEAAIQIGEAHTLMARAERVEKDELFVEPNALAGRVFGVGEVTAGYRFDFLHRSHLVAGIGTMGMLTFVPDALRDAYGKHPASVAVFTHLGLR